MHKFTYWHEGLVLIIALLVVIVALCTGMAFLGSWLIQNLGQYPSKSEKFHMQTAPWLFLMAILIFGLFALAFHILSD